VRVHELHVACARLGVSQVTCLDLGDGQLHRLSIEILVEPITAAIRSFRPDIVISFGEDGAYGHPDHVLSSVATTKAVEWAGDADYFPDQLMDGLALHRPARLYHSVFPRRRQLLLEQIVGWLKGMDTRFHGDADFVHGLMLFAIESTMLGYASDHINVGWYPKGFYIMEQGEPASKLYLLLSGSVDILREDEAGTIRHVDTDGPGAFLGEAGLATGQPRNAHVVAADNVTCLEFSAGAPTAFAGRGKGADHLNKDAPTAQENTIEATTCIDVSEFVPCKIAAIAAHRSQFTISPEMFPKSMLQELLGREYFFRVHPPVRMESEL
jgi:LmbE family N-acetylglucosaminyl deacetylase